MVVSGKRTARRTLQLWPHDHRGDRVIHRSQALKQSFTREGIALVLDPHPRLVERGPHQLERLARARSGGTEDECGLDPTPMKVRGDSLRVPPSSLREQAHGVEGASDRTSSISHAGRARGCASLAAHLSIEEATQRLPATLAELVEADDGTLLRMRVNSLDWMACILAGLDCGFTIYEPDELRVSARALADRLVEST